MWAMPKVILPTAQQVRTECIASANNQSSAPYHDPIMMYRSQYDPRAAHAHALIQSGVPLAELVWVFPGAVNTEAAGRDLDVHSALLDASLRRHASSEGSSVRQGVEWIRWPGGREQVRALPDRPHAQVEQILASRLQMLASVGIAATAAAYGDGAALPVSPALLDTFANRARAVRAAVPASTRKDELVSLRDVVDVWGEDAKQVVVHGVGTVAPATLAAHVVDALEAFAADASKLAKNIGRVMLTFDGLGKDAREVWDIPEARDIIRAVARHLEWWPLLTHRTHAFVWLAACSEHSTTRYLPDGEVFLDFDPESLRRLAERSRAACLGTLADAKLNPDCAAVQLQHLHLFVADQARKRDQVAAGELTLTDTPTEELDPLLWKAKFEDKPAEQLHLESLRRRTPLARLIAAVDEGRADKFGLVIDHSAVGSAALTQMRATSEAWIQRTSTQAVRLWEQRKQGFLVVFGSKLQWSFATIPCESLAMVLEMAIPMCAARAGELSGSTVFSVCTDIAVEPKILGALHGYGLLGSLATAS